MKKRKMDKISLRAPATLLWLLITALVVNLSSCETGASIEDYMVRQTAVYDPAQPVTITSFSPDSGTINTQIIIHGSNFGSDVSIIQVMIDDVNLPVIGADGTHIYALLGKELSVEEDSGILTVYVGEDENKQKTTAPHRFRYKIEPYVITVAGFRDEKNESSTKDGPIKQAQFHNLHRVTVDKQGNVYVLEEGGSLRFIPYNHSDPSTEVSSIFRTTGDITKMTSLCFSNDYKHLYITNFRNDDQWAKTGVFTLSYDEEKGMFDGTAKEIIKVDQCYGGDYHPVHNVYFYSSQRDGKVFKWLGTSDPIKGNHPENSKELFKVRERGTEISIHFEPHGNYAYLLMANHHQILKCVYNWDTQELEPPTVFVGAGSKGMEDGVGTAARINDARQGTFDEEGNFYIGEHGNHVIRKITKNGIVSVFAGIPGKYGNVDGSFDEALFNEPQGIVYDRENKVFYVADRANRSLRMIVMPKN